MKMIKKLNPLNSLFGRIFLWFWLAMLLIIITTAWVARQAFLERSLQPLNDKDQRSLIMHSKRLSQLNNSNNLTPDDLRKILMRMGQRSHSDLLLINVENKDIVSGFMPRELPMQQIFLDLVDQPSSFSIRLPGWRFAGPEHITLIGTDYVLFVGKREPPNLLRDIRHQPPYFLISIAVILSGLLCLLLSWSLVTPLRRLKSAANKMSKGDLSSRSGESANRQDEIGQLAHEFDAMAGHLENLIAGQKRMLADISHELRSPLARLQVAIGIAQQQQESTVLTRIETEAQRIESMLAQILTLSRLDSAQAELKLQTVNLADLLDNLIEDADFEASAHNKELEVSPIADIEIKVDSNLFCSAIENLLRNAIKYARHKVNVDIKVNNHNLQIQICDDGPGVSEHELDNIFRPFYRTASSRSRDSGGVGLGLAISQRAIESMNGSISADLKSGGGLCITVCLQK
ncbi:ATP-binding protein [Neptunicella marina]|uniref:histidine kinase n=1 Tax=Neptunicella marina TaxID=2125989 RepID=A0A8J6M185_9ALTE|nr:ATP-binding protein [Neptunicella marina]MBC3767634.1 HAMP domain-containing protein [Neptunicella marina]